MEEVSVISGASPESGKALLGVDEGHREAADGNMDYAQAFGANHNRPGVNRSVIVFHPA
jgi:hypothetical protein